MSTWDVFVRDPFRVSSAWRFFLQLFAAWRFFAKTYKKRIWKISKKSGKSEEWNKRWMTKAFGNDKREFDIETYHSTGNQSDIWLGEENMIVKIFFPISFLVFPAQCLISCSFQFNSVPIVLEKKWCIAMRDILWWACLVLQLFVVKKHNEHMLYFINSLQRTENKKKIKVKTNSWCGSSCRTRAPLITMFMF